MDKRIIAYSLLAYINNQSSKDASYDAIFTPLVKRGLSKMCSTGQFKGDDINDIKKHIDDLYGLNMPIPVLKKILAKIASEINTLEKTVVQFFSGGSFIIKEYVFDEFEEEIEKRSEQLDKLQEFYQQFLKAEGQATGNRSIFDFVEESKASLGKYINKKYPQDHKDNTIEARFINFIKPIEKVYNVLQSVYVGSIISTYLEYQPSEIKKNVELVLDTNFIISLLDLNTPSSKDNCNRLLEIAGKLGYKFTVLAITIKEIDQLLRTRVDYFDIAFLSKLVDPEDIYNACERRGLTKTDLDRIRSNVQSDLEKLNITIIPNTAKFESRAKNSTEYEKLKEKRNTTFAALHDATCIDYVKEKRGKLIYQFDKVNCWFLNNSSSRRATYATAVQPYSIKAEDLLNLLWLTSPMVKGSLSTFDFSSIGLSRLVSTTLDDSLPNASTIRSLDGNIQKYAKDNITDEDVVRVAKGIAERTISNLEELNKLAESDDKKFVETLQGIANQQKKKEEDITKLLNKLVEDVTKKTQILEVKTSKIDKEREDHERIIREEKEKYQEVIGINSELAEQSKKMKAENINLQNQIRKPLREKYIRRKVFWWRTKAFLLVLIGPVVLALVLWYVMNLNNGDLNLTKEFIQKYTGNVIVSSMITLVSLYYSGFFIKLFSDRFNHSAVMAYRNSLDIPDTLKQLTDEK
ncbi:hypothetical protein [Terrimonas alba]|uniref:hypothetical protein n=1 Tax=Terrimonas alba TaxID=3349636 RepID=UPI0035F3337A